MSKNVQELLDRIDELDEDEERYLADRDLLPEDYERQVDDGLSSFSTDLNNVANTGDANTRGYTVDQLERMLEKARKEQMATSSVGVDDGTSDEYEDYDEGWTNDARRAELAKRGLDTSGDKATMIERLRRDDGTWEEDDK